MKQNLLRLIVLLMVVGLSGCASLKAAFEEKYTDEYKEVLKEWFVSNASCMATGLFQKEYPTYPIYQLENEVCHLVNMHAEKSGHYYTENRCNTGGFDYKKTRYDEFCKEIVTPKHDRLGNPAAWSGDPTRYWTLPRSAALPLSTLSTSHNQYPFMTRARYKSVSVPENSAVSNTSLPGEVVALQSRGQCELEVRIYKRSPSEQGLKPLMAIHGGAWRFRGSSFAAFESEISHFTERGFVVFAPFYRLVDEVDGNSECNQAAWPDIVSDMDDALDWVKQHGADYGAQSGKTYLLGGSAGGHLAAWLTVHRPDEIERSLLFYPATDFQYYLKQAQQSEARLKGEGFMEGYLGGDDLENLSLQDPDLLANSFPALVVDNPEGFPPVAMIHGLSDTLVPSDQSVRLCNALNGDIENGPARNAGGDTAQGHYSQRYPCGAEGALYIINEAGHALDVCVENVECPAGGKQSQRAVAAAMDSLFDWLAK